MLTEELIDLARTVQGWQAEAQAVEVKSAHEGCPKRLYDTLSSFSNQDEGGTILFGLDETAEFETVGVYDAQSLQKCVTEQCLQMQPVVRPLFTVAELDGKTIVSAEIPPVDLAERPCFYKGKGRVHGSYRRVGESDEPMTEYEVYSYEAFRKSVHDDVRPLHGCTVDSLDAPRVSEYLLKLKTGKPHLSQLDDERILSLAGIMKDGEVTLGGEWLFGVYPQAFAPQLCVVAVCIYGTELGEPGPRGERFADNKRIEGTIPDMLERALAFVKGNLRMATSIDPQTGSRVDEFDLPVEAVREVILNALIHRDYSVYTEGMPVSIELFSDRLEIRNPGGLYGRLRVEQLGETQPDTRNPMIATAMETLGLTENRYSGIPTIKHCMRQACLPEPEFYSSGDSFKVVLRRRTTDYAVGKAEGENRSTKKSPQMLLEYCETPRSRQEIARFMGIGSAYAMSRYVEPLLENGSLLMTMPEKPRSKNQRFVRA